MDEAAAWRELESALDAALWRYAEAAAGGWEGSPFAGRMLHLARLSAARRLRAPLDAADRAAAAGALEEGASYPMLAAAAGMARQAAWRRYRLVPRTPGPAAGGHAV